MATAPVIAFVSVEDYLRMAFEHDAEYVEGRIEKRPVPEFDHADMTAALIGYMPKRGMCVSRAIHAPKLSPRVFGCRMFV